VALSIGGEIRWLSPDENSEGWPEGNGPWQSPFYRLPPEFSESPLGFTVTHPDEVSVALKTARGTWHREKLPAPIDGDRIIIFPRTAVEGFAFSAASPVTQAAVTIENVPLIHGGKSRVAGIGVENSDHGVTVRGLSVLFESGPHSPGTLKVDYQYEPSGSEEATLVLQGEGKEKIFDFHPRSGEGSLYFHTPDLGFTPDILKVDRTGWKVASLEAPPLPEDPREPLTADTGTILHFDPKIWRNPDYEIFRWTLFPEILNLSTRNYRVQSAFFKRLAFFVEKPGFAGTLATNQELEGRHGWNAHDYSAESLAAFYSLAARQNFPLNPEEVTMRDILVNQGVIIEDQDQFLPGRGALLGTSLETFYEQRFIFMTHESIHGLYFIDPEFRRTCEAFYDSLSLPEQQFWINFLSYRGYNVPEDRKLLITEVAAFLLQQPPEEADDYFIGFITPRLLRARPHLEGWLVPFLLKNPTVFSEAVTRLGEELERLYGLNALTFHDLLPRDRSRWKIFEGMKAKWMAERED